MHGDGSMTSLQRDALRDCLHQLSMAIQDGRRKDADAWQRIVTHGLRRDSRIDHAKLAQQYKDGQLSVAIR